MTKSQQIDWHQSSAQPERQSSTSQEEAKTLVTRPENKQSKLASHRLYGLLSRATNMSYSRKNSPIWEISKLETSTASPKMTPSPNHRTGFGSK